MGLSDELAVVAMAFRFKREGDYIKRCVHMERMGMQPWIEDFKWRVMDWHYGFYLGPKARNAILSNQKVAASIQDAFEKRSHGFVTRRPGAGRTPGRTKYFAH